MRFKTRRHFLNMSKSSFRSSQTNLSIDIKLSPAQQSKLGITVTRKFGCACKRNRLKRLVREAFRLAYSTFSEPFLIHVRPKPQALEATFEAIKSDLTEAVRLASDHFKSSRTEAPAIPLN